MFKKRLFSEYCELEEQPVRRIRSFVRRQRRLTKAQSQAIEELWPGFGVDYQENNLLNFISVFGRKAPVVLEIGFGMGHSLVEIAKRNPENNYLGIEVHRPGIGACLQAIKRLDVSNVRIMCYDAVDVLQTMIPNESLASLQLFFPDPWPKVSHHKRRIIQLSFVNLVAKKLIPEGIFYIVTDWQDYASYIETVMSKSTDFSPILASSSGVSLSDSRPATRFELRGIRLGYTIQELAFKRRQLLTIH